MIIYNLVIAVISWLVIYVLEKRNIAKQWFTPSRLRLKQFLTGFAIMAMLCIATQVTLSAISQVSWRLAEDINLSKLLSSITYDFNSVLFEELIFRGVLLYLLIKYSSDRTGIIVSAIAFGIYHWYSQGVFGNLPAMLVVFIVTGFMGYVFATACANTRSLVLPFGLHLGWNLINHNLFSNGPKGIIILQVSDQPQLSTTHQLISFALYIVVTVIALAFVRSKYVKT